MRAKSTRNKDAPLTSLQMQRKALRQFTDVRNLLRLGNSSPLQTLPTTWANLLSAGHPLPVCLAKIACLSHAEQLRATFTQKGAS